VLVSKKIFRMSGPVVTIGFILLIPSVLGMAAAALMFFGVISYNGTESSSAIPAVATIQEDDDTHWRRICISTHTDSKTTITVTEQEQYCECSLSELKAGNPLKDATHVCAQRLANNTLSALDQDTQTLYSNLIGNDVSPTVTTRETPQQGNSSLFHIVGGTVAVALGIASFVGGLLGWLLVMKKRVLQCSVCGAAVNAS
jgi:hypothetical protein